MQTLNEKLQIEKVKENTSKAKALTMKLFPKTMKKLETS